MKAHGALYNMTPRDPEFASAIARAVAAFDKTLILLGLPASELIRAGQKAGLRTAAEGFADRAYEPDGSLASRRKPGSVIHDPEAVVARAVRMVHEGGVVAIDGSWLPLKVDTICTHGDTSGFDPFLRGNPHATPEPSSRRCLWLLVGGAGPRAEQASPPSPDLGTQLQIGGLFDDRNDDGVVDVVDAHLVVGETPTAGEVAAAADVGARLGFETAAMTLPLGGQGRPIVIGRNGIARAGLTPAQIGAASLRPGEGVVGRDGALQA